MVEFQELFLAFLPVIILIIGIILVLINDLLPKKDRNVAAGISLLTLIATVIAVNFSFSGKLSSTTQLYFANMFEFGGFYRVFSTITLIASIIVIFSVWNEFDTLKDLGVLYSLLFLANAGGLLIASSQNLIPLNVGFELMAISTYGMVAYRSKKKDRNAAEAAMKLFILGAFATSLTLFGMSYLYGATGSLQFNVVLVSIVQDTDPLKILASLFMIAGASFKLGLVPFHWWLSDIYSGTPISIVNFLATASKKMAFAFVFQLFLFAVPAWNLFWGIPFAVISFFSMIVGNGLATVQNRITRILAYSTVAQSGYIIMALALAAQTQDVITKNLALTAGIIYIIAHVLMKSGVLLVVGVVVRTYGNDQIDNFKGLIYKDKILGISLAVGLMSLLGVPPLLGFFGKAFLFIIALTVGNFVGYALAASLVLGSVISAYYYFRILGIIIAKPVNDEKIRKFTPTYAILIVISILLIFSGLFAFQFWQLPIFFS